MKRILKNQIIKFLRSFQNKAKHLFVPKTQYIEDNYFRFAEYVCAGGMLEKGNIYVWDYVIKKLKKNANILEIGSFAGLSTVIINYLNKKYEKDLNIYTVDYWKLDDDDKIFYDGKKTFKQYNEFVKQTYINNLNFFHPDNLPFSVHDSSQSFFNNLQKQETIEDIFDKNFKYPKSFDFCFIDGDHSYSGVKTDFENVNKFTKKGAYILFDDSADGNGFDGINKFVNKLLKEKNYKLIMKNPNYLFQKI